MNYIKRMNIENEKNDDPEEIQLPDSNKPSNPATTTKGEIGKEDSINRFIDEGNPNTTQTIKQALHQDEEKT